MRDLRQLVSEQLLPRVERPSQYIGLETNARCNDVHSAEVTVGLGFPDTYTIGISHLGSQVLYQMLNETPGIACDRLYCPQIDAESVMHHHDIPLFGWESRCAARDFDLIGFSLAYELCATNVLTMLDLAGIPLHATDRSEQDPLVIAGDAMADTPEPIAEFIDLFIVGDGEEPLAELVELLRRAKHSGARREEILLEAARTIRSVYVPRFYQPHYDADGKLAAFEPTRDDVPTVIHRASLGDLAQSPAILAPLVPICEGVHERVMIEIMRGCPNACRFCQAGSTRLPVRTRSVTEILRIAREAIAATGYREISLLSLSTSDYPHLTELIDKLNAEFSPYHVSISLPSLRVDTQLSQLPKLTSSVRKGGLTIAAEAGTERLRKAIRKRISEDDMLRGVRAGWEAGWRRVKVYFMAGLPGETDEDIDAIFELSRRLSQTAKEVTSHPGAILANVSWLVPKPHTPMQWEPMRDAEYFFSVRRRLRELSRRSAVQFKFHRIERSVLECVLVRGDRRMHRAIEAAWKNGARMDAWNEHFDSAKWDAAFEQAGIDPGCCAHREIPTDELTPWSHIKGPHDTQFLLAERRRMQEVLQGGIEDFGL